MHIERTFRNLSRPVIGALRAAGAGAPWRERVSAALRVTLGVVMLAGPVGPAFANDLSNYPCTAGDVEIIGSGIVVNEPCVCPPGGKFTAKVQFTVRNNTSTGRYCIAIHLVPDGEVLTEPMDLILKDANGSSTAPGKSGGARYQDTIMFAEIPNFDCNTGLVCFGDEGVTRGKCEPGHCTTISWNTSPGQAGCTTADETPPGGQCRHQQVCVIGYSASLACTSNCGTTCEGTATLKACAVGPQDRGPYTLTVTGDDGSSQSQSTFGDPSGQVCLNFSVSPGLSPKTTYTLTVTDKNGCTRTATTSLNVATKPVAKAGPDQNKCSEGATTAFTLAGTATNGTAKWSVVSGTVAIADVNKLDSGVTFTGTGTATLRLTVTNPPCPPSTDDVVLAVIPTVVSIATPTSGCNGVLKYVASVVDGAGCGFAWTIDGQSLATFLAGGSADDGRVARVSGTGNATLEFRALDNVCHTIGVAATCTSSAGSCTGTTSTQAKQCVGAPGNCQLIERQSEASLR